MNWNKVGLLLGAIIMLIVIISTSNYPAGIFIGTGTSMIVMIISNLEVDHKKRN